MPVEVFKVGGDGRKFLYENLKSGETKLLNTTAYNSFFFFFLNLM